jgi:hypothetical protein
VAGQSGSGFGDARGHPADDRRDLRYGAPGRSHLCPGHGAWRWAAQLGRRAAPARALTRTSFDKEVLVMPIHSIPIVGGRGRRGPVGLTRLARTWCGLPAVLREPAASAASADVPEQGGRSRLPVRHSEGLTERQSAVGGSSIAAIRGDDATVRASCLDGGSGGYPSPIARDRSIRARVRSRFTCALRRLFIDKRCRPSLHAGRLSRSILIR